MSRTAALVLIGLFWVPVRLFGRRRRERAGAAPPQPPALSKDVREAIEMAECALESKNAALDRLEQRIVDLDCRRAAERLAGAARSLSLAADSAAQARQEAAREHARRLEEAQREVEAECEAKVTAVANQRDAVVRRLEGALEDAQQRAAEKLTAVEGAAQARLSAFEAVAESRLEALRRSHVEQVEELERSHAEEIAALKRAHAEEIQELERTHAAAMEAVEAAADARTREVQKAAVLAMRTAANTSKEAVAALKHESGRTARRSRALERTSADRDAARAEVEKLSALLAKRERAYRELLNRVQTYVRQTDSLPGSLTGSAAASPKASYAHGSTSSHSPGNLFSPVGAGSGLPPPSPSQRTFSRANAAGSSSAGLFSPGSQASSGIEVTPKARHRSLSRYSADETAAAPEAAGPSPVESADVASMMVPASSIDGAMRTPSTKTPLGAPKGSSAAASSLSAEAFHTPLSAGRKTPLSATPRPRSAANAAAEALLAKAAAGTPLVGTLAELSPASTAVGPSASASPQRGAPVDPTHLSAKIAWLAGSKDDDEEGIRAVRSSHKE